MRPRRTFNYGSWWGRLRGQVFFREELQHFREGLEKHKRAVAEGRYFCKRCGKRIEPGKFYGVFRHPIRGEYVLCSRCADWRTTRTEEEDG